MSHDNFPIRFSNSNELIGQALWDTLYLNINSNRLCQLIVLPFCLGRVLAKAGAEMGEAELVEDGEEDREEEDRQLPEQSSDKVDR